jgi:bifunctional enzyme CysN/CysC
MGRDTSRDPDLLRFSTAGSVDDGKSTMIGRLLFDTRSIMQDQLDQIEDTSRRQGETEVNLALLTDGLRAEREQKITIDVAYRYFATSRRKFIIADTPGHLQYTRNMVTGASTSDLAVVLVDARKGILTQTKRHAFIASLLGIQHLVVAVNKMDLVDWSEATFDAIRADFEAFARRLTVSDISFVPMSALLGDNVVKPSTHLPWYRGGTLLDRLENVVVGGRHNAIDFRFPVQYVIRPHQDFRGFAGTVASGRIRPGEEVTVLPSGAGTRIRSIETFDGPLDEAGPGDAVTLTVEDEVDISRGDMIVRRNNRPRVGNHLDAYLCWLDESQLDLGRVYTMFHTTRSTQAQIRRLEYRVDVDTLHREAAASLQLNEIGRVEIETTHPVFHDSYRVNTATGSFILVDPGSNLTVAAGMIRGEADLTRTHPAEGKAEVPIVGDRPVSPDVTWEGWNIPREAREARHGHRALVAWFTGMSGSGKSSVARELERRLFDLGYQTVLLDGDHLRHGLCGDLGFSAKDRSENIRRVGELARLFFEQGCIVICTFISPFRSDRERVRARLPDGRFLEIHVKASLETLQQRDPKGLYARARSDKEIVLPGVGSPYEVPESPELLLDTEGKRVNECVQLVQDLITHRAGSPPLPGTRFSSSDDQPQ